MAETFDDYSHEHRFVGKFAKYGHDTVCKPSCSHHPQWFFILFYSFMSGVFGRMGASTMGIDTCGYPSESGFPCEALGLSESLINVVVM